MVAPFQYIAVPLASRFVQSGVIEYMFVSQPKVMPRFSNISSIDTALLGTSSK